MDSQLVRPLREASLDVVLILLYSSLDGFNSITRSLFSCADILQGNPDLLTLLVYSRREVDQRLGFLYLVLFCLALEFV